LRRGRDCGLPIFITDIAAEELPYHARLKRPIGPAQHQAPALFHVLEPARAAVAEVIAETLYLVVADWVAPVAAMDTAVAAGQPSALDEDSDQEDAVERREDADEADNEADDRAGPAPPL